jgi:hypothetical protein
MAYVPFFSFPVAIWQGRKCIIMALHEDPWKQKGDSFLVADFETGAMSKAPAHEVLLDTARLMNIKGDPV